MAVAEAVADLTALDDFECYARWWADGRRLPTFSLRLDPPPPTNGHRTQQLTERSAQRYGRPREQVAKEIEDILARRAASAHRADESVDAGAAAPVRLEAAPEEIEGTRVGRGRTARNQNRDRREP